MQHAIEYAMNMLPEKRATLTVECLPEHFVNMEVPVSSLQSLSQGMGKKLGQTAKTLRDVERCRPPLRALKRTDGNISAAARGWHEPAEPYRVPYQAG